MSHSCPECGMACYCSGDIEDHDTGEEYTMRCTCCLDEAEDYEDEHEIARLRSVNADLQAVLEAQQKLAAESASWQQAAESANRFAFVLKNALIELVEKSGFASWYADRKEAIATARDLFDKSALDFSSREAVEEWARKHPSFKSP